MNIGFEPSSPARSKRCVLLDGHRNPFRYEIALALLAKDMARSLWPQDPL